MISTDQEWNAKIENISSCALDSKDFSRIIADIARKLKDASDRYHTFKDRAIKLKEEKDRRKHLIEELKNEVWPINLA